MWIKASFSKMREAELPFFAFKFFKIFFYILKNIVSYANVHVKETAGDYFKVLDSHIVKMVFNSCIFTH